MTIPGIGQTRGIFEIFVPGVFLLSNILGALYVFTLTHQGITGVLRHIASHSALSLALLISFGYLLGMVLRMFMTKAPDSLSAWYLRQWPKKVVYQFSEQIFEQLKNTPLPSEIIDKLLEDCKDTPYYFEHDFINLLEETIGQEAAKQYKSYILELTKQTPIWMTERFPYIQTIGEFNKKYLHNEDVKKFYDDVWRPNFSKTGNLRFANFCKTSIYSEDAQAMTEIAAAESMSRYISGMFYSLAISSGILFLTMFASADVTFIPLLLALLVVYIWAIWGIISRFRFMRIKEAQMLFDASYQNRKAFLP